MSETRRSRSFSEEFKVETLKLLIEQGKSVASVSRDLSIHESVLRRWKAQYAVGGKVSLPSAAEKEEKAELKRIKRENEILRMERDILKKTISILSQGTVIRNIS